MQRWPRVALCLIAAALVAPYLARAQARRSSAGAPIGVSPGGADGFLAAEACPTFGWAAAQGTIRGYELVVYRAEDSASSPALRAAVPPGALGWTPPADGCLAPGRYAWSVRAVGGGAAAGWSEALLFEVRGLPTEAEYRAALELVRRYLDANLAPAAPGRNHELGTGSEETAGARSRSTPSDDGTEARQGDGVGTPVVAVRGEVLGGSGPNFGLAGISHSPDGAGVSAENLGAGPDLLLAGAPPALISESSFTRDFAGELTFDFTNPGGAMTLRQDGVPVVTEDTDQDTLGALSPDCGEEDIPQFLSSVWTCVPPPGGGGGGGDADTLDGLDSLQFLRSDVADTMNGTLTLAAGDLALHDAATVTKAGAQFLWDSSSNSSFSAGRYALANGTGVGDTAVGHRALYTNTTGSFNTASGFNALKYNTTGSDNTASGYAALRLNTTGIGNTATGRLALNGNTVGNRNTAIGQAAMNFNSSGNFNTAAGDLALTYNTTGSSNTAIGYKALRANETGSYNVALGERAGYGTNGSSNVMIANHGVGGESNTLRIGRQGSGPSQQNRAFIAGIYGTTASGYGQIVVVDNNGQLATAAAGGVTDDWVDTAGDSMTGLLSINPASGFALQTSSGDSIDLGGDLFKSGIRFLHNPGGVSSGNTGVGDQALPSGTTGVRNTALGAAALIDNTSGSGNTAAGYASLVNNTTGIYNTALGSKALYNNTLGTRNTATGYEALKFNVSGFENTATGVRALAFNATGYHNTAVGHEAMRWNSSGDNNTAIGWRALYSDALDPHTGIQNTAVGTLALGSNTTGPNNTAVGNGALSANTTGNANTALGFALGNNTTGYLNTGVGQEALRDNVTGARNTALGAFAGRYTTGSSNILIGNRGLLLESNTIRIGEHGVTPGQQNRAFVAGIFGTATAALAIPVLVDANGQLGTVSSSRRFKQDIEALDEESARLLALRPVRFRYKEHAAEGDLTPQYGLIAEEVAEVFPELVITDAQGRPETVRYHLLAPLLLAEVQREHTYAERQEEELAAQRATLARQQEMLQVLLTRLEQLEAERMRR